LLNAGIAVSVSHCGYHVEDVYGTIMERLFFDATELESVWRSTMQSYLKLRTKRAMSIVVLCAATYFFKSGFSPVFI